MATVLATGLMTELEVVNKMLRAVDLAPVNSITGTLDLEAGAAVARFSEINRLVQTMGWDFNTRPNVKYLRNVSNEVTLGTNVLSIKPVGNSAGKDYTMRGGKVYDRESVNGTTRGHTLTEDPYLTIIELIEFTDLPNAARSYIAERAVREHERFDSADDTKTEIAGQNELNAWATLINDHSVMHDETLEDNPEVGSSIFGRA
jgi:hypothetical protein